MDEVEVVRKGVTEEEERGLEHERQTFHDEIEAPGDHSVHLALSMLTAVDNGSTHLNLSVTVEPLLAQHGDERGEKGSGQARIKNGLDVDDGGIGAIPLRESGIVASWDVPKRGTGDNLEELVAHFLEIRFEFVLDIDNERGCDCGKQTGLFPRESKLTS